MGTTTKLVRNLKVALTVDEVAQRADRLAQLHAERKAKNEERKLSARALKAAVDAIDEQTGKLADAVRHRAEWRDVTCEERRNDAEARWDTVRLDTGETVESRPFGPEDRQGKLFALPALKAAVQAGEVAVSVPAAPGGPKGRGKRRPTTPTGA